MVPPDPNTIQMGVWARVAQMIPGRKSWQCRERFTRHVDPRIDRNNGWTWEEDVRLVKAVKRAGTYAWVCIQSEAKCPGMDQLEAELGFERIDQSDMRIPSPPLSDRSPSQNIIFRTEPT